ncbi:MAG: hypothetical protein AYK23_01280 [Candidatus Proteinoplasmatales archaeon SG8-5]|nr:MAG: hypothetical protein AYK23_01280 [Candidatus Proteinoplasmatales archaeon SG8-5]
MVDNYRIVDSKKYMWDGKTYDDEGQAKGAKIKYEGAKFETEMFEEEGKFYVYTRRVVTDVVVEGSPF